MSDDPRLGLPSASKFHRVVMCPGSEELIASLPLVAEVDQPRDEDAESGAVIHMALETGDTSKLNDDERETYNTACKLVEEIIAQWCLEHDIESWKEMPREERLWLHDSNLEPIASGQLDRHYSSDITPAQILIIDFKTLYCPYLTPSERNWQGRVQAVSAWKEYEAGSIRFAFCKPRVKKNQVEWVDYTPTDLMHVEQSILFHLWEAKQPGAPRRAGQHCIFCPAKADCPEGVSYTMLPSVIGSQDLKLIDRVNQLAPVDLVKLLDAKPIINKVLEAVDKRLKSFSDEELAAIGLGRGKPKNMDPITDTKGAFEKLHATMFNDPTLIWSMMSLGKTDLVERLRERGMTEKEAKEWIATELADFITKKQSERSIVRVA